MDGATTNGSEQIFLPALGGGWRPGAKVGVYDPSQLDVPILSPGQAAAVVYGRGFDDPTRGWVMYEAGHNHEKHGNTSHAIPDKVAAQRAFFNFSFFSSNGKTAWFDITIHGMSLTIVPGSTLPISFSVPDAVDLSKYTIQWSSSCGGTFVPGANPKEIFYTPPAGTSMDYCIISVSLTDACGRAVFSSRGSYAAPLLAASGVNLSGNFNQSKKEAHLNWHVPATDGIVGFQVEKSAANNSFSLIEALTVNGNKTQFNYIDNGFQQTQRSFYRIKMISADGSFKYSNVISLGGDVSFQNSLNVISNPVRNGTLVLNYESENEAKAEVLIIDAMGKKLLQTKNNAVYKGITRLAADVSGLSNGTYFALVRTEQGMMVKKFIVNRY
jgi:hypothetical protein